VLDSFGFRNTVNYQNSVNPQQIQPPIQRQ